MFKKRKLKRRIKRLNCNKSRRILQIYRLKRRISARHRIGFMMFQQKN
ncbi:hypothetical protein HT665_02510 [Ursidibacter maritimus]|uniref:Uncharacterized protein n=1 Tax=Ursidibacter maritimus TaxID=1331689 RepID=A0A949T196_9PAST|nr:hypothetical protein [Ursidibacter maritimus]MBV6523251.1 hypothetical protein [Ursidibacter maritimus]MBV6525707.1 hypothetical protein [Ursidibacter maritimus]MBV6527397.1 hypothetical protein [Ursidibacter maritimus]MBV6529422.1 hypothetical protein [Ursidibacter maritimus]MBV6531386.1 hypothetical protein [Ursidibacter maritimus]